MTTKQNLSGFGKDVEQVYLGHSVNERAEEKGAGGLKYKRN